MRAVAAQPEDGREAWRAWIARQLPGQDVEAALAIVDRAVAAGLTAEEVAALLRRRGGGRHWPDQQAVERARYSLSIGLARLDSTPPAGSVGELRARWEGALQLLGGLEPLPAAAGAEAGSRAAPGPAFSWRRFFGDHAIQLLGYSGAFLLGIAVLLYDLSGQSPGRFFALAALDLALFGAAYLAARNQLLQVLARAYTAMAAVLLPLTLFGAYVFLDLRGRVPVLTGLAVGGAVCAATYGYLALALKERAYGWISVLAAEAAVLCAVQQVAPAGWAGAAISLCGLLLIAAPAADIPEPFRPAARWLGLASAAAGALAELVIQIIRNQPSPGWAFTAALAVATIAYGLYSRPGSRRGLRFLPVYAASLLVVSIAWNAKATQLEWQWTVLALSAANVAAARFLPGVRWWEEAAAGLCLGVSLLLAAGGDPPAQAIVHLVALAGAAVIVWRWRSELWTLYATVILALGWYWFGSAVLPKPPQPGPDDLARLYAPLPLVLAAAGAGLRTWKPPLRLPPYLGFAVLGVGVSALAGGQDDLLLAGAALLVYSALAYGLLLWERRPALAACSLVGVLVGAALLVASRSTEAPHFVLLIGVWSAGMMLLGRGFELEGRPEAGAWDRRLALGGAAATAVGAAAVAWSGPGGTGLLETALALALAAGCFAFDRLLGREESLYAAIVAAAGLSVPIAVAAGLENPQWRLVLVGAALVGAGAVAAGDSRLRSPRPTAILLQVAGLLLLFGLTIGQMLAAWGGSDQWPYTQWLAVEGVIALIAGVAVRSRWPALAGGVGLIMAAISALFLLAAQLPLSAIFGILAAFLIGGATGLALLRGRIRAAGTSADWGAWL